MEHFPFHFQHLVCSLDGTILNRTKACISKNFFLGKVYVLSHLKGNGEEGGRGIQISRSKKYLFFFAIFGAISTMFQIYLHSEYGPQQQSRFSFVKGNVHFSWQSKILFNDIVQSTHTQPTIVIKEFGDNFFPILDVKEVRYPLFFFPTLCRWRHSG